MYTHTYTNAQALSVYDWIEWFCSDIVQVDVRVQIFINLSNNSSAGDNTMYYAFKHTQFWYSQQFPL